MNQTRLPIAAVVATLLVGCADVPQTGPADLALARNEVLEIERAFARTMADRDFEGFVGFLSDETIFMSGPEPLRGKQAVADAWRGYFDGPEAPFSWEPTAVEVLSSGGLALSTGPVRGSEGTCEATFTSVWRLEDDGSWRIVFDRGTPGCEEGQQ